MYFDEISAFCEAKSSDIAEMGSFTLLLYFMSVHLGNVTSWYQ